ncbi:hypothetical protein CPC08DRAFT_368066 [Agrocybe pediades]|nr:hypothetical protein CPC08DRAFT_368066 [Agrocybe pediades]
MSKNYRDLLNEKVQSLGNKLEYAWTDPIVRNGRHEWVARVFIDGIEWGAGRGSGLKEAKEAAAQVAYGLLCSGRY